jgi:hypothetical protein
MPQFDRELAKVIRELTLRVMAPRMSKSACVCEMRTKSLIVTKL